MDKAAIKAYAVEARRKLMEAVKLKAQQLYIFEDSGEYARRGIDKKNINGHLRSDGIFLTPEQLQARELLYGELLHEDIPYKPAIYNRIMENVACTWFNRLIALRIMEVNGWLPSNIRILSSREEGRAEPDALHEVERLPFVNQAKVAELRADTDIHAAEKLYKYVLISQCNALSAILPGMFQKEHDYTELLLPDALLARGGIVNDLVGKIREKNFDLNQQGQIEIIGWLYQYYISEKKDEVFAGLKKNIKINKDTIPAATQLFTPEWIVKYMVENSLGRLWLEAHPNAALRAGWNYYVDEAQQEPQVAGQLRVLRAQSPIRRPEDIKLIDPCMGSGHILVYAFEVLFQIYRSVGYAERDIPNLILQHNLYGLDIDDRAGQLAYFALMMKARSCNRRFFRQEHIPQPMVFSPKGDGELMEYGSLTKTGELGEKPVLPEEINDDYLNHERNLNAWNYRRLLAQKYDIVVTNPPYMGGSGMNATLAEFVKKEYPDSKSDLFAMFIEKCGELLKPGGYQAMITQHAWMFLSSYEKLRSKLIGSKDIINMAHLGARAFEEIGGEVVQTTAFVLRNIHMYGCLGVYARLVDYNSQQGKEEAFLAGENRHAARQENFEKIPGMPVAYWVSEAMLRAFIRGKTIDEIADVKHGMSTGKNEVFVREWWEIKHNEIDFNLTDSNQLEHSTAKYYPYNKGGEYRLWYGNAHQVVLYGSEGRTKMLTYSGFRHDGREWYFRKGITWSFISSSKFGVRLSPNGFVFDVAGSSLFPKPVNILYLLGFLSSTICFNILMSLNPTLNFQVGNIKSIPVILDAGRKPDVDDLVTTNISLSRADWDAFETSWDFIEHPFIAEARKFHSGEYGGFRRVKETGYTGATDYRMDDIFDHWNTTCDLRFEKLKANEEELNRIFIDIYGLGEELTPEVEDKDVTVRRADLGRDVRSFISYAVGCMFGRYSLDEPRLAFAGGAFDMARYKTFLPEDDNIIPIGSADYFDDDIVVRFTEFVRAVYGGETLGENLRFIADALYRAAAARRRSASAGIS